uniref:Uncharacterized protein n=1 Tax=Rhizophora mucronata TaxID=61149 RepID=A0A2P2NWU8_RHIMU
MLISFKHLGLSCLYRNMSNCYPHVWLVYFFGGMT